ncbi:MAG: Gfo/Idh/MocA family oxidoreductase, partial [Bacteroidota bacterium]
MMEPLNVGVIGVGHLGSLHTKMYAQTSLVNLIGVYDVDSQRAKKVAAEFGIRAFSTLDELLSQVEAVSIATATQSHYDVAMQVIKRGVHLLIEKPITTTIEQAKAL